MESFFATLFSILLFIVLYFQIFLLVTYFEHRGAFTKRKKSISAFPSDALPSVTIIVPCWNEEKTLTKTITSLLELTYPREKLSIFIIDDGSTDATRNVAEQFLQYPHVKYFFKENGGKHTALNEGLLRTTADFVGCLDADSFVSKDALLYIVPLFKDEKVMVVTPAIKIYNPRSIVQKIQETEYMVSIIFRKILATINAQYVAPGPFSIYRRSAFSAVGVFKKAHNTEDMEMALRMHAYTMKIENAFMAEVYTIGPRTLREILNQRLRWTYGFVRNAFDYRGLLFRRRHGDVGTFSLPAALISIFGVLYFTGYFIVNFIQFLSGKILWVSTIGVSASLQEIGFQWFFVNTETTTLLLYTSALFFGAFLLLSIHHVRGRFTFSRGDFYFVLLYGFIVPLWMGRAVAELVFRRPTKWR